MTDDKQLRTENDSYRTALEMISEELGLPTVDPEECLAAIRALKAGVAPLDEAEDQFMYWSIQFGAGETSETSDPVLARNKFERWKAAYPDERVELMKFYARSVDGQNLDAEYDLNGRRIIGQNPVSQA